MRVARALGAAAVAVLLLGGAAACGGGSEGEQEIGIVDPSLDPDAGVAPEDVRLPASQAAAALRVVKELAQSAATALGPNDLDLSKEDATTLQAEVGPSWALVAPTVKEADAAAHTTLEAAFPELAAAIAAGDAGAARTAADKIAAAVDAYIARFPSGSESQEPPSDGSMPGFTDPPAGDSPAPTDTPSP